MSKNIIYKEYNKLSIQISLNGLSFYSTNSIENTATPISYIPYLSGSKQSIEDKIETVFLEESIFEQNFDTTTIIIDHNLFTPVPSVLFDKDNVHEYLKHTVKTLPIDDYQFDIIENHQIHNVYIMDTRIQQLCEKYFDHVTFQHATSILIKSLLDLSKNSYEAQFYVHIQKTHFEITVINKGKLILINSFEYNSIQDFLYYILFVAEQLELNPEKFQLFFIGSIKPHDDLYNLIYKYVRHVYLVDEASCNPKKLNFSYSNCLHNFILVNS